MPIDPEALKSKREKLKLTQQEVAERASLLQQAYSRVESGAQVNPSFATAEKIADALKMPLDAMRDKPAKRRKSK